MYEVPTVLWGVMGKAEEPGRLPRAPTPRCKPGPACRMNTGQEWPQEGTHKNKGPTRPKQVGKP